MQRLRTCSVVLALRVLAFVMGLVLARPVSAYLNDPPLCDASWYAVTWCASSCPLRPEVGECMMRQDHWCGNGLPGWEPMCVYEFCGGGCPNSGSNGSDTCTTQPQEEICGDGIDNDRNGCADEGCPQYDACGASCVTQCDPDALSCNPPPLAGCDPPPEVCGDLEDNDCDGAMDEGCPSPPVNADQIFYYYTDPVGTAVAMADAVGAVRWRAEYLPFGEESVLLAQAPNDRTFVGKSLDGETGLVYFGARYFNPWLGRFVSPDPIGPVDAATQEVNLRHLAAPQCLNPYAYGNNNPYRYVDPNGETPLIVVALAAAAAGAAGAAIASYLETGSVDVNYVAGWAAKGFLIGITAGAAATLSAAPVISSTAAAAPSTTAVATASTAGTGAVAAAARFDWSNAARVQHIFRNVVGHLNPVTDASKARMAALFERVASNPGNLRPDAVKAGIISEEAAGAGVQAFTAIARNGEQVWVAVRNGTIVNAGINAADKVR